jgi:hypothetical protein
MHGVEANDRTRAAAVSQSLTALDAWLLSLQPQVRNTLRRGLGPKTKHTQLHWAASELGVRIPHDLRALYTWHNGQSSAGSFLDRVLAYHSEACALDVALSDTIQKRSFLPLAAMVRRGAIAGERLDAAFMREKFGGNYVDDYVTYGFGHFNGAEATQFLPFAALSSRIEGEDDESGEMCVYLETRGGAILAFDPEDDDADHMISVAPSLAAFIAEPLERMQRGLLELPSAQAPTRKPRQEVHAGKALLAALLEGRFVELAADVDVAALESTLRERLSLKRNPAALRDATAFLMQDARISEVFLDEEELTRLVAEFLGR